ncbi:MAG: hypothetical protein GWN00_35550, partial [Aliifodinibius sp.]|nr:hypothetical protein [Fodinibius sp.]NIV15959.1 hypothetical protein [Fodinibius sp.]NIY29914.1 hypothetical protein [Fodinibius sp.]
LVFKNGRFFDPSTGIWITFGGMVLWQLKQSDKKRKKGKKGKRRLFLFICLLILVTIAITGCIPEDPEEQINCSVIFTPSGPPPALKNNPDVLLFGGIGPGGLNEPGPEPADQLPHFNQIATEPVNYPGEGGKEQQALNVTGTYPSENKELLIIGYSAGADAAMIYAKLFMDTHPEKIEAVVLLAPTMSGSTANTLGGKLEDHWKLILDELLLDGTDIYLLDDAHTQEAVAPPSYGYSPPGTIPGETGDYHYVNQDWRLHYDPTSCCGDATNNSIQVRDQVVSWYNSR